MYYKVTLIMHFFYQKIQVTPASRLDAAIWPAVATLKADFG
jgi:hypothetical protein